LLSNLNINSIDTELLLLFYESFSNSSLWYFYCGSFSVIYTQKFCYYSQNSLNLICQMLYDVYSFNYTAQVG